MVSLGIRFLHRFASFFKTRCGASNSNARLALRTECISAHDSRTLQMFRHDRFLLSKVDGGAEISAKTIERFNARPSSHFFAVVVFISIPCAATRHHCRSKITRSFCFAQKVCSHRVEMVSYFINFAACML